jgi:sortase (surface protein transpeptidase)
MTNIKYALGMGLLAICAGILLVSGKLVDEYMVDQQKKVVVSRLERVATDELVQGRPIRIVLPSIGIDVSVVEGLYDSQNKTWTLGSNSAFHIATTPLVNNQSGGTYIYGHDIDAVFGKLSHLRIGEEAVVYTDNNKKFIYQYRKIEETSPEDNKYLSYKGDPILMLQTCSGLWSQNRIILTFDLKEYS